MRATEVQGDRRVRLLSVATAFLFLFSFLGLATHQSDNAIATKQVSAAAEATTRTGTAAIELRIRMKAEDFDVTITGTGVVDFVADRSALTLTTPGRQPFDVVFDGVTVYERDSGAGLPGAKPWVVQPSVPVGASPAAAGSSGDPVATVRMLEDEGLLEDVRHDGDDEVGGVRAARYTAAVDGDKLRTRAEDLHPAAAAMARTMGVDDMAVTVWVSDDGLLRRVETTVTTRVGEHSFVMSSGYDLRDFGAPARVETPPPDQVARPAG